MGVETAKFRPDNTISRTESKEFQRQVREATRNGRAHISEFSKEARSFMSNDLRKKNRSVLRSFGETEKSFQRMLKKSRYYGGAIDGIAGKGTQIAYINFEKESGFWKAGVNDGVVSGRAITHLKKISKSVKLRKKPKKKKSIGEKISESFDRKAAEVYNKSRYNLTKRKRITVKLGIKNSSVASITQAVYDYQVANGLDNDGKLGPATLKTLTFGKSTQSVRNKPKQKSIFGQKESTKGIERFPNTYNEKKAIGYIAKLGKTLKRSIAGKLGISKISSNKSIARAVLAFQSRNGLDADGIPGSNTQGALGVNASRATTEKLTHSASLNMYLRDPKWRKNLRKFHDKVPDLASRPLAMLSDISQRKSLIIENGKVKEVPAMFGKGTTPKALRYAKTMAISSSPKGDASRTGSATVLGGRLDFGDKGGKHVHAVDTRRLQGKNMKTEGCVGLDPNTMYNLCSSLIKNAILLGTERRRGKQNKHGWKSEKATLSTYKLKNPIPVLTV